MDGQNIEILWRATYRSSLAIGALYLLHHIRSTITSHAVRELLVYVL